MIVKDASGNTTPQLVPVSPVEPTQSSAQVEYVQNDELCLSSLQGPAVTPSGGDKGDSAREETPFMPQAQSPTSTSEHAGMLEPTFLERVKTVFSSSPAIALPLDDDYRAPPSPELGRLALSENRQTQDHICPHCTHCSRGVQVEDSKCKKFWKRHFLPMRSMASWKPLIHLTMVNFPFALAAWLYIFVCTVTGATLLFALPLGLLVCFLNILGARLFARWELAIQAYFHGPPSVDSRYRPMPIFYRDRSAKRGDIEAGTGERVRERSFLKNVRAMVTDSTSYQALFYFIVIKPAITSLLGIFFLAATPVAFVLVFPAPHFLKLTKRIGLWQANVAVEGLVGEEWYRGYARAWQDCGADA